MKIIAFFPEENLHFPFHVANHPGLVLITLDPKAVFDPLLEDVRSYGWIHGAIGRVIVDLSRIMIVNSVCCSWIVNLQHAAEPATISIAGANARIIATLRLLGLDAVVKIDR